MIKFQKLPDLIAISIAFTFSLVYKPTSGWILFFIGIIPMLLNQAFFYSRLYKRKLIKELVIFGLSNFRTITGAIGTFLIGGGIIFILFYFQFLNNKQENLSNWIWLSILISKMIESLVPLSYWNVIAINENLYVSKFFGFKKINLKQELTIRKITNDKIELHSKHTISELTISEVEIEKLVTIIKNVND